MPEPGYRVRLRLASLRLASCGGRATDLQMVSGGGRSASVTQQPRNTSHSVPPQTSALKPSTSEQDELVRSPCARVCVLKRSHTLPALIFQFKVNLAMEYRVKCSDWLVDFCLMSARQISFDAVTR